MKKFGTWLLVLIVAAVIVYVLGGFDTVEDVVEDTVDVVADTVEDAANVVEDTAGEIVDAAEEVVDEVEEVIEADEEEEEEMDDDNNVVVDLEKSSVLWEGRANGKSHDGDIQLTEASLEMDDGKLVGGSFVIDMTTINSMNDDGEPITKLNEHLQADDFFDVANHATSTLVITKVTEEDISADLTIKGLTHPVTLQRTESDNGLSATFSIDSSQWGVQDGGSLIDQAKDALVSDDIDFVVSLILQ